MGDRKSQGIPEGVGVLLDLDALIRAQVLGYTRTPGRQGVPDAPDPSRCQVLDRVAATSPAGHAGLAKGDLVVSVDGRPAAEVDPDVAAAFVSERRWEVVTRDGERVALATTACDPGVALRPTPEAIARTFEPTLVPTGGRDPWTDLQHLWEGGAWDTLATLADRALAVPATGHTPAVLFRGAALWERGRREEGLAAVREFHDKHARGWTMNFGGIARFYLGRAALEGGDRDGGARALEEALEWCRCARIADEVERVTGRRLPAEEPLLWVGRPFPCDYDLPVAEGEGAGTTSSLRTVLAALPPGGLHAIVMLGSYRANGPYSDLMKRWRTHASAFGGLLPALHAITSNPDREGHRPQWLRGEEAARDAGAPFALLFDADDVVGRAVDARGSPYALLVDAKGTVQGEGWLDGACVWDAFARAQGAHTATEARSPVRLTDVPAFESLPPLAGVEVCPSCGTSKGKGELTCGACGHTEWGAVGCGMFVGGLLLVGGLLALGNAPSSAMRLVAGGVAALGGAVVLILFGAALRAGRGRRS